MSLWRLIHLNSNFFRIRMKESSGLMLLLTTLSLASCSPMLGSGQCSWGPSYWCANIPQVTSSSPQSSLKQRQVRSWMTLNHNCHKTLVLGVWYVWPIFSLLGQWVRRSKTLYHSGLGERNCSTGWWWGEIISISKILNPFFLQVCKICKDMVGQARDTLLSNETQEELKEVFDGSCDLIPIKIVAKECRTLSDQFIPELVETLASEMNPDT